MKALLQLVSLLLMTVVSPIAAEGKPNIIFIMADDMGYGELGCYGQQRIKTPHLDQMAREGLRFTRMYAGSTVCAPSRSVLMTGKHIGHTTVRGNAGAKDRTPQMLKAEDVTIAEALKQAGYATGLIGKWGLGMPDDEGHPNKQGFDYFYGYLSQLHAHNHFPDHLWRNSEKVPLRNEITPVGEDGAGYATNAVEFAGDLLAKEAIEFIRRNAAHPFFLCFTPIVPHANNERVRARGHGMEVPDFGPYDNEPWTEALRGQAAMVTRLDADIGRLLKTIHDLRLAQKTLVIFTSDNGPQKEGGQDSQFFDPNGPLRGYKRELFEGGIRVPFIACWPGKIQTGISAQVSYFGDMFATFAELASAITPSDLDSLSIVPTLLGHGPQAAHDVLYWEFHESGFSQAVLLKGRWKGMRLQRLDAPIQIYDLETDPRELNDLAPAQPDLVEKVENLFKESRTESPLWPINQAQKKQS